MKKILLCLCLAAGGVAVSAQTLSWTGRLNLGIGARYGSLDYQGSSVLFSPGGGSGLEAGLHYGFLENTTAVATAGFQYGIAYQYQNTNGLENKTSFSFGRGFLSLGVNQLIPLSDRDRGFRGMIVGAGTTYWIPGSLSLTENNTDLGTVSYSNIMGYYAEVKVCLALGDYFSLQPGIRYRNVTFKASDYSKGGLGSLNPEFARTNGNGLDISVAAVREF